VDLEADELETALDADVPSDLVLCLEGVRDRSKGNVFVVQRGNVGGTTVDLEMGMEVVVSADRRCTQRSDRGDAQGQNEGPISRHAALLYVGYSRAIISGCRGACHGV